MRLLTCALVVVGAFCADPAIGNAFAQIRKFPYRAAVEGDNVYVRSGPGRSYYPTSKLRTGDQVTVHRHDPGGWYMIAPPAGSFSWIRANHVDKTAANEGVLNKSNVIVRVGSTFGDTRDIEQVRLSKGAHVSILGESTSPARQGGGIVKWYKIASPRGEYRWVSGRNIVPLGARARRANDTNPYAIPSNARRDKQPHRQASLKGRPSAGGPALGGPSLGGGHRPQTRLPDGEATSFDIAPHQRRLDHLDNQFRQMVKRKPRHWDFSEIEAGYESVRQGCAHASIRRRIASRMAAVKHYKTIKADYEDIIQVTAETSARERELARMQRRLAARAQLGGAAPVSLADNDEPMPPVSHGDGSATSDPQPALLPTPGSQNSGPIIPGAPQGGFPTTRIPARRVPQNHGPVRLAPPVPNTSRPATPTGGSFPPRHGNNGSATSYPIQTRGMQPQQQVQAMRPRRFDGAGIIRRVVARAPGMPQHALVAPNGRILAYLQPVPGLPLDKYVGRSMGVYGQRFRRQDLRNDFIQVRAMMPVRLLP